MGEIRGFTHHQTSTVRRDNRILKIVEHALGLTLLVENILTHGIL